MFQSPLFPVQDDDYVHMKGVIDLARVCSVAAHGVDNVLEAQPVEGGASFEIVVGDKFKRSYVLAVQACDVPDWCIGIQELAAAVKNSAI